MIIIMIEIKLNMPAKKSFSGQMFWIFKKPAKQENIFEIDYVTKRNLFF